MNEQAKRVAHTREPWAAESEPEPHLIGPDRIFLAFFEGDEADQPDPDVVLANARRAAACVNACAGMENPEHEVVGLKADSGYLRKYRDAYCALVTRESNLRDAVKVLVASREDHPSLSRVLVSATAFNTLAQAIAGELPMGLS